MIMALSKHSGQRNGVGVGFRLELSSYCTRLPLDCMHEAETAIHGRDFLPVELMALVPR